MKKLNSKKTVIGEQITQWRITFIICAFWTFLMLLLNLVGEKYIVCAKEQTMPAEDVSGQVQDTDSGRENAVVNDHVVRDNNGVNGTTKLYVDNKNRYKHMSHSYAEGYVPSVENGVVHLVVPIVSTGKLKDSSLEASLSLGDIQSMPFICKNYKKQVVLSKSTVNDGAGKAESYVVYFPIELKEGRYNGSYPITLNVSARDEAGIDIAEEFTVYVNISDGRNPVSDDVTLTIPEPSEDVSPTFTPRLMVQDYSFSKEEICAGDTVKVDITLENVSADETIRNLLVTLNTQGEYISVVSKSDSLYVDSIPAGKTEELSYEFSVRAAAPQGQYNLTLAFEYADVKGSSYTGNGSVKMYVNQPLEMEFDTLSIDDEVRVADVIKGEVHAMNLGKSKAYNVRAVIEADGLRAWNTIFIGDIEAGETATGSVQISVSSLSEGSALYGSTKGTVTYYYEDEDGVEYTETRNFDTKIMSPFSEEIKKETKDNPAQWWIIMIIIIACLIVFGIYTFVISHRRHTGE
ncbi:MAG: hypothetical protein K2G45_11080 [Lachnospiraceae bacterium]|nr:hypothetical protein [Lachnospiraceae bacterium]